MTNRGKILSLLVIVLLILVAAAAYHYRASLAQKAPAPAATSDKPMHIIVIDICSLRADHLGSFGYARPTSPNLDAFAKDAASFDNFWTESGWCLPNLATMLTGTRPEAHDLDYIGTKLSPSITTLAEVLRADGYATAGFSGSRYMVPGTYGLEKGFTTYADPYTSADVAMGAASYHTNAAGVDAFIAEHRNESFFLYVTIDDLHSPYSHAADPKLFDPTYKGVLDTVPADLFFDRIYNGDTLVNPDPKTVAGVKLFKEDPKNLYDLIARYDASVAHIDGMTGQIFKTLKDNDLWDTSLIIVTAHQGEQLGEHGHLGHITGIYQPILHVPFFVRYPGVTAAGTKLPQLSERIDIPATILDAAGLLATNSKQFTGMSLLPLLKDPSAAGSTYIFASSKPTWEPSTGEPSIEERAVRNDRYKLIWYKYKKAQYELYDLQSDPNETKNLIDTLPDVVTELKAQLDQYVKDNPQS